MRMNKRDRQVALQATIGENPFITDEELADKFHVSIQTIRLDRLELSIPELRERIKHVAERNLEEQVKALPIDEVIGEIIDIIPDQSAISIFDVKNEHVFKRNNIARGHHLFAQANSLAVALINNDLALTAKATIKFTMPVKLYDRVISKAKVIKADESLNNRTIVEVKSYVGNELVLSGEFEMYRSSTNHKEGLTYENRN